MSLGEERWSEANNSEVYQVNRRRESTNEHTLISRSASVHFREKYKGLDGTFDVLFDVASAEQVGDDDERHHCWFGMRARDATAVHNLKEKPFFPVSLYTFSFWPKTR